MYDPLYLAMTVAFFALMLGYVAGCARIGRGNEQSADDRSTSDKSNSDRSKSDRSKLDRSKSYTSTFDAGAPRPGSAAS